MKILILGLDGVPRRLLEHLAATAVMPVFHRLIGEGVLHDLAASIPEISSVSWTSFMTGTNPGTHGVYGFTDLMPGTRKIRFPRFPDVVAPTFWDRLGSRGLRTVVVNQPSTYPVRPVSGALVAGFVALDLDRAVYPATHLAPLEKMGYRIDVDSRRARHDKEGLLEDLVSTLAVRERAVDHFWSRESWDLFEVVVTGTDRLQHFLFDALEEEGHPLHARVLDYYHRVDAMAGRLVDRFRNDCKDGAFFALSDHGFTRCRQEFRINAWLQSHGYLEYTDGDRTSPECLAESTRVFALDPGRLYFTAPGVELEDEIIEKLVGLTFEGEPVVRAVHRRADIYQGPLVTAGPDLVVQTLDGFDLKATLREDRENGVFVEPAMTGMHNPEAFLLADRPCGKALGIEDLAALIEARYE